MSKIKSIGEGVIDLITHGTVVILVGVPLGMFICHLIAAIFFFIGILFILVSSGIQLDIEQNRIRKYRSLLGFKFGKWRALFDVKKLNSDISLKDSQVLQVFLQLLTPQELKISICSYF